MYLKSRTWVLSLSLIVVFYSTELVAQFTNVAVAPINKAVAKDGGIAWADFNADGFLDLIVNTNSTNAPALLLNKAERSVMAGDIDGDGDLDFMRSTSARIEIYTNNGPPANPTFTLSQLIQPAFFSPAVMNNEGLAWMDFDGDGDLDVFMENHGYPAE